MAEQQKNIDEIEKNPIRNKQGAIAVEAVFVIPIVIVVVLVLIYAAMVQMQTSMLQMHAYKTATKVARIISNPGYGVMYEKAGSTGVGDIEFSGSYTPNRDTIKEMNEDVKPYRYWGRGFYDSNARKAENETEEELQGLVGFIGSDKYDVKVSIDRGLSQNVTIKITQEFQYPGFVRLLGLEQTDFIQVEATVHVMDMAEFVRNTDVAFDFVDVLTEKFGLKEKIGTYIKRVKDKLVR